MKRDLGLTEQFHVTGPVVYGFLRLPAPNPARRTALAWALAHYCDTHELTLASVLTDLATLGTGTVARTPGLVGLLDAINAQPAYGVVMSTPAHLGGPDVREQRSGLLQAIGLRVMFCRTTCEPLPADAGGPAWSSARSPRP